MTKINVSNKNWRVYATIVATILAVIFVYWQREAILKGFEQIKNANPVWLLVGIMAQMSSVVAAATVYYQIALKKTKFFNLFIAQTASLFTSRVTPASVGGIATMGKVLSNSGHKVVELSAVISTNAIVTFMGNVTITLLALIISGRSIMDGFKIPKIIFLIPIFLIIALAIVYLMKSLRQKVVSFVTELLQTLKLYEHRKKRLLLGFLAGLVTTLGYMVALWAAGMSMGVNLSVLAVIVTVSLGTLGASATPLPGGVVGAEATLALTMTQFGVSADQAIAIAFTYRFITYWLPILPGYIATQYALRSKIL